MKRLLFLIAAFVFVFYAKAQTFTQNNSDGVEIKYTVTSDGNVKVEPNNYSGRVVVPETVTNDGVTYQVNEVGFGAFRNRSGLTFVQLPASIEKIGNVAFNGSNNLDTLVLLCPVPPLNQNGESFEYQQFKSLFGDNLIQRVILMVPAGRLAAYRRTPWVDLINITSPSALPLTLHCTQDITVYSNGVLLHLMSAAAGYKTLYFEEGDTTCFYIMRDANANNDVLFIGWDNGEISNWVVDGADTINPIMAQVGYGTIAVNNVSTPMKMHGQLGYLNGTANYFVPAQSNTSPLYANGLWISGAYHDAGDYLRTCASKFSNGDYVPGPLKTDGSCKSDMQTRINFNRVWSVSRQEIDDFIAHVGSDGYDIPENILSWPGNGDDGYAEQLAPYYDADSDGVYNPHHGDYPLIRGDRMLFCIFNDVSGREASIDPYPMGIEVHVSAYAFDEPDDASLNNTLFLSYKIINRSNHTFTNVNVGEFVDFDLGYASDDYIGCDVKRAMAYCYNGKDTDGPGTGSYSGVPPAQGCAVLAGPTLEADGVDNPKVDIEKMRTYFPEQLANYLLDDGVNYDIPRLTADADQYYPLAWHFAQNDELGNNAINGANFGNGIIDDERLGMRRFVYYENSSSSVNGEPTFSTEFHMYLNGFWKNGQHMKYGGNAVSWGTSYLDCDFMFPDNSDPLHWGTNGEVPEINPDDWNEATAGNAPGDRRGLIISGSFNMQPGEDNTLDLAFTTAIPNESTDGSLVLLQSLTDQVRRQFVRDTTDSGKPFTYMPYSAPLVGLEQVASQHSLNVFPNPANNRLTVALGDGNVTDLEIYDIRGQRIMLLTSVSGIVNIDISSLQYGVYILRSGCKTVKIVKK